jgi:hypothetical protein
MNTVQLFKHFLKSWGKLIEQCNLTRENGVAAEGWGFDHPEHGVGRRIDFVGVVCVVFSGEIGVGSDVATRCELGDGILGKDRNTYLSRPMIVTWRGSC